MTVKKSLLFKIGALVIVLAIAVLMFFLGRGHTVYIDNKDIEYEGKTYEAPYKVTIVVNGEQVAKLYEGERGMSVCIGSNFNATLLIMEQKGGEEQSMEYSVKLPFDLDGVVVNLPAHLAGLSEDVYMSEFVSLIPESEDTEEDEITYDEFGMPVLE